MTTGTSCVINQYGISAPTFNDILNYYTTEYQSIMGMDAILSNDSKMGQLFNIIASAQNDSNSITIQAVNGFSPTNATGTYLSSLVKINGIQRQVATNSTAIVRCTGIAGTNITNGVVQDNNKNLWNLSPFTIPATPDYVDVLATCQTLGSIQAITGSINTINNPTYGWQTAVSVSDATPGNPVETDYQLRNRQSFSTSTPAISTYEAILSGILNLPGVTFAHLYENNTNAINVNGIPAYSIAVVTDGGDPIQIATTIAQKKSPGVGTYGSLSEIIYNNGFSNTINFSPVVQVQLQVIITINPFNTYSAAIGALIPTQVQEYVNSLGIGSTVYVNNTIAAIQQPSFNIATLSFIVLSGTGTLDLYGNVQIPFSAIAYIDPVNVSVIVL